MSITIWNFLWKGWKNNDTKFYLINWNVVRFPKEMGGLGIWDPLLVNIALGAKLV